MGSYVNAAFQFTALEIELACLTLLGACAMENKLYFRPFLLNLTQDLHSPLEQCMSKRE